MSVGKKPDEGLVDRAQELLSKLRSRPPRVQLTSAERDELFRQPNLTQHNIDELLSLEEGVDPAYQAAQLKGRDDI